MFVNSTFFVKESVLLCSNEKSSVSFSNIRGAANPPVGGVVEEFWVGMCRWDPGTLSLYQT